MSQPIRIPDRFATALVRPRKAKLGLNRPATRKASGTKDTAFRARRKAKRVRLRKLQRNARRAQR